MVIAAGALLGVASSAAGLGMGISQSIKAKKLKIEADKISPALEDPRTLALLDEIKRKARTFATGTDPLTSRVKSDIDRSLAKTQASLTKISRGDSRILQEGLENIFSKAVKAKATVSALAADRAFKQDTLVGKLTGDIASRSLDIKMSAKAQALREAAELRTSANINISGAIPGLVSGVGGFFK